MDQQSRCVLTDVTVFLTNPQTKETQMLYSSIEDYKFAEKLEWDQTQIEEQTKPVTVNTRFKLVLGTNQVSITTLVAVVSPDFSDQY